MWEKCRPPRAFMTYRCSSVSLFITNSSYPALWGFWWYLGTPPSRSRALLLGAGTSRRLSRPLRSLGHIPVLTHPNFDQLFILFTDASNFAIRALLSQKGSNLVTLSGVLQQDFVPRWAQKWCPWARVFVCALSYQEFFFPSSMRLKLLY